MKEKNRRLPTLKTANFEFLTGISCTEAAKHVVLNFSSIAPAILYSKSLPTSSILSLHYMILWVSKTDMKKTRASVHAVGL